MNKTYAFLNSRAKVDAFTALADKPNKALVDLGIVFKEEDAAKCPKTEFLIYASSVDVFPFLSNPYYVKLHQHLVNSDFLVDPQGRRVVISGEGHAFFPCEDLAIRMSEGLLERLSTLPRAVRGIYLDQTFKKVPNYAWAKVAVDYRVLSRELYDNQLRIYQHELILRLRRAGIKIVANTHNWSHPLFDEITLEYRDADHPGGISVSQAQALFMQQQTYVQGSVGTLWYAPENANPPAGLWQRGTWE